MLAGVGPDLRIPALSWETSVTILMLRPAATTSIRPAGIGHDRLVAALCAQYVPKFLLTCERSSRRWRSSAMWAWARSQPNTVRL
jgi:hypothetical protein